MKKKLPPPSQCTIMRTVVIHHSTVNMATGKQTPGKTEVTTQECGTPLFGDHTGICRACAEGWEVPENKFANPAEKIRAAGRKEGR